MDPRVVEFHNIMPQENIPSVLQFGILSNEAAAKIEHRSIALIEAQAKRDVKQVPGGLKLHQYANLYFHARNPMMYKRREEAPNLCVLRVSPNILNVAGVVLADRNAAGNPRWVRFLAPHQWHELNFDYIFARSWTDPDCFAYYEKKRAKCAEVLVPYKVEPSFLLGAYVVDASAAAKLERLGFSLPIAIEPDMFFQ
jgi:hypothetical protein